MLSADEVLSLAKIPRRVPLSELVASVGCESERTLRNWVINPPRPPQKNYEQSAKLIPVLRSEDPEFRLPLSDAASMQIMQMRAKMDRRDFPDSRLSFMRVYEMDMERWPDVCRKQETFQEKDWDVVLCCFYYQFNLAYCGTGRTPQSGLEDPEVWDALTHKMAQMADAAIRGAGSARTEALYRLIKVSLLWRRIQFAWHCLSRKEEPAETRRASDAAIYAQVKDHLAKYGLIEETVALSKELPDFVPPLFNAIAVASGLREADRYAVLYARLRRADERFGKAWFEAAYQGNGKQHEQLVFAKRYGRWVDADFKDFIRWLNERETAEPQ